MLDPARYRVVDLSVCLEENYPLTWPGLPAFQKRTLNWFQPVSGPHGQTFAPSAGGYYAQALTLDEHTGTHVDFPSHVIPPSDSGLPNAGRAGNVHGENYPLDHLCGPAAVVDVRSILDQAPNGISPLVTPEMITAWEKANGKIQPGEVVLLDTGYTDKYFAALPDGHRMYVPLTSGKTPGWPAPAGATIELLHSRGVHHVGISAPTIGAVHDLAEAHVAGLSREMSFTEMLVNLDQIPARGAYYFALPLKIAAQSGGPTRAFALVPK